MFRDKLSPKPPKTEGKVGTEQLIHILAWLCVMGYALTELGFGHVSFDNIVRLLGW